MAKPGGPRDRRPSAPSQADADKMASVRKARRPRGPLTESSPLSPMEERFAVEYVADENGAAAARRAGYARRSAHVQASQLLTRPNVAAAIDRARQEWRDRAMVSLVRQVRDIATAANLDPADYQDAHGNYLPLHQIPVWVRRAIQSIEMVKRNMTAGDGVTETVVKLRFIDKARMHELLARITGLDKQDDQEEAKVPTYVLPADTAGVSVH